MYFFITMRYLRNMLWQNDVDQKLNYISMKRERHGEENEQSEKENVFGLCTLDSFRGRVNVVQSDLLSQLLHDSVSCKKTLREGVKNNADWKSEVFHVNVGMIIKENSNN